MDIRQGGPRDLEGIYAIEVESFASPWSKESLALDLENPLSHYVVLEEDGDLLAYGAFMVLVDEGHILNLAVAKDYRGQGHGKTLMEAMIQAAKDRGLRAMTLEVRPSNKPALGLYDFYGFEIKGRRKNYYGDNHEDAYILWKEDLCES
ncbi:ribosomal protein S18-alanine N-acetyltransferase [Urinicoccus timonensis]|uniref:ribosomal protein S18-alanine N-acetyltransferase n=1 Tax=Urinicoccus timonensis TaxID=2024205 RepID=UPI000C087659|nr:ribosomal protein S18-alanine N-acetyltransferase [Urinicoccus timonensis]